MPTKVLEMTTSVIKIKTEKNMDEDHGKSNAAFILSAYLSVLTIYLELLAVFVLKVMGELYFIFSIL